MSTQIGTGDFVYEVVDGWGELPSAWTWGDVAGVAVDSHDRVYAFKRGPDPVAVFGADGKFLNSWGKGVFTRPHAIQITSEDVVYCTDDGDHTVRRCTLDGEVQLELGTPGVPSPYMSGRPFRRCTHTALSPEGDIYVSDGYGNAAIHKYTSSGTYLRSFGGPGIEPGHFNLPHALWCDPDGRLYVADRENHRIQVFDGDGTFETEWHNLHRPGSIIPLPGTDGAWLVSEMAPVLGMNRGAPNLGPRLSVLSHDGQLITRIGSEPAAGLGPGQFLAPHGIAVDSRGDIYVAQVSITVWPLLFPSEPPPADFPSLIKLAKVAG